MKTIRRTRVVQGGDRTNLYLDKLTRARIDHLIVVAREVLGVETNLSGIVRASVKLVMEQIENAAVKKATLPLENSKRGMAVWVVDLALQHGTRDLSPSWSEYPEAEVIEAIRAGQTKAIEFDSLHADFKLRRGVWATPKPELAQQTPQDDADDEDKQWEGSGATSPETKP